MAASEAVKCPCCGHSFARREKIAGYHYYSGWFWDSVEIQTRGQKANKMTGLPKAQGLKVKEILERMKE